MRPYIALLILLPLLQTCAEPKRDCLDIQAVNFAVDADAACSSCCEYPELRLEVQHKIVRPDSTLNLVLETGAYPDGAGNLIRFRDIRFYISDLHLVRPDGSEILLEEKLNLRQANPGGDSIKVEVEDNFALVTPSAVARRVLGTVKAAGAVSKVRFKLGIAAPSNLADPNSAPSGHPLAPQSNAMWAPGAGYTYNKLTYFPGISAADTIPQLLEIKTTDRLRQVELPLSAIIPEGYHLNLVLQVDYLRWLEGIDFRRDTPDQLSRKVADNSAKSFRVIQITAQ